jgi:hypothetical protein
MYRKISAMFVIGMTFAGNAYGQATKDPDPALNNPDKVSWELFVQVTKPAPTIGNNNVVFETWASDEDTFQQNPLFPGSSSPPVCATGPVVESVSPAPATPGVQLVGASPKILKVPALERFAPPEPGAQLEATVGGSEEVRRNQATFDFIYCNKLYTRAGLKAAFASGKQISLPIESIEVKANWVPASSVEQLQYHVNTASDGKQYALVSMHIISKQVPNWTWATFEHKNNKGRCDFIDCRDNFGTTTPLVKAHTTPGGQYPACEKSDALKKMFSAAGLPALWQNYCLKGSQADFTTATGVPVLLGNSVTERGFVNTSSCLSCHSRASVLASGDDAQGAGFLSPPTPALCPSGPTARCSPNGTPDPNWFWNNPGKPNQSVKALQTDFIWAIPLFAIGP